MKEKKKKPLIEKVLIAGCFIVPMIFVIYVLSHITITSNDTTPVMSQVAQQDNNVQSEPVEIEQDKELKVQQEKEARAHKLLDEAKAAFEKSDYAGMLKKCNSVLEKYPDTEIAETVPNFIVELRETIQRVTAIDIVKEYNDNEVRADGNYKDKLIIITGEVKKISVDLGTTYIYLSDGKEYSFTTADCAFKDEAEIAKVADVEKGDTVTILGKCTGSTLGCVRISNSYILD